MMSWIRMRRLRGSSRAKDSDVVRAREGGMWLYLDDAWVMSII